MGLRLLVAASGVAMTATAWDGPSVAALMNKEYHGYDPNDEASSVGVYLRQTTEMNVYCHMDCFQGMPDCRISGSVYNSKQMLTGSGSVAWTFGKKAAWYVNQTLLRTKLSKCSYPVDGGTMHKYNMGCGCACTTGCNCGDKDSAFANLDPATNYTKKNAGDSARVAGCVCDPSRPEMLGNCLYKGSAFYPPGGTSKDDTHAMLKYRLAQHGSKEQWNEMILDGEVLLQELTKDAAATIPAIIYNPKAPGGGDAKTIATTMAEKMAVTYNLTGPVPVIKVDTDVDAASGKDPFVFEVAEEVFVVV